MTTPWGPWEGEKGCLEAWGTLTPSDSHSKVAQPGLPFLPSTSSSPSLRSYSCPLSSSSEKHQVSEARDPGCLRAGKTALR